jgi:hypothetical protein
MRGAVVPIFWAILLSTPTRQESKRGENTCVKHVIILAFWLHLGNCQCDIVEKDCERKRTIPPPPTPPHPTIPPTHPIHKNNYSLKHLRGAHGRAIASTGQHCAHVAHPFRSLAHSQTR